VGSHIDLDFAGRCGITYELADRLQFLYFSPLNTRAVSLNAIRLPCLSTTYALARFLDFDLIYHIPHELQVHLGYQDPLKIAKTLVAGTAMTTKGSLASTSKYIGLIYIFPCRTWSSPSPLNRPAKSPEAAIERRETWANSWP